MGILMHILERQKQTQQPSSQVYITVSTHKKPSRKAQQNVLDVVHFHSNITYADIPRSHQ